MHLTCNSRLHMLRPALSLDVLSVKAVQHQQGNGLLPPGLTASLNWPKGYSVPPDVVLGDKSWGEGGGRRDICGYGICLPLTEPLPGVLRPSYLGSGWTPACWWGSSESVPFSTLLGHTAFTFPIELLLPPPTSLLTILPSLHLAGAGSKHAAGSGFGSSPGSAHSGGISLLLPSAEQVA